MGEHMAGWPKTINVDKKIVPLLSEATYTDLCQVIREFVNNSYDADATIADIKIDLANDYIEITDNGDGMTEEGFGSNFLTIAHTPKKIGEKTKYGRQIIGKFGVGYLSATRFCKYLKIESTVEGNPEIFEAAISCEDFFKGGIKLVWEIPVNGRTYKAPSKIDDSYTKIILDKLTPTAKSFLKKTRESKETKRSIKGWSGFEALHWKLQQILPLEYSPKAEYYSKYLKHDFGIPMEVYINGKKVYRNPLKGDILFEGHEKIGDNIECKYVIITPWETVKPQENVGLQIRLKNVGIGLPSLFGASFLTGHLFVTTRWICGEIQIIKGLENALSISRNEFTESEDSNIFHNFFHNKILKALKETESDKPAARTLSSIEKKIESQQEMLIRIKDRSEKNNVIMANTVLKKDSKPFLSYKDQIDTKLGKPGIFKVETIKYSGDLSQEPIELDAKKKRLKIVENHPALCERIFIENKDFLVNYESWDIPSHTLENATEIACKINPNKNEIIFNENFRLFRDKTNGDLYKEVFSILSYAIYKNPKNKEINNFVAKVLIMNYLNKEGLA